MYPVKVVVDPTTESAPKFPFPFPLPLFAQSCMVVVAHEVAVVVAHAVDVVVEPSWTVTV